MKILAVDIGVIMSDIIEYCVDIGVEYYSEWYNIDLGFSYIYMYVINIILCRRKTSDSVQ